MGTELIDPSDKLSRFLAAPVSFVLSMGFFVILAYALGRPVLEGPFSGGEISTHLQYADWLNRYFPEIPNWNPQVGAGVSLRNGASIAAHLLAVIVARSANLSIPQVLRLISFLTLPATAFGIYLLGWSVSRRQTVALIAGLFYLVAPISWTWVADGGLYSLGVGLVFLPIALASFSRYLEQRLAQYPGGARRLWLATLVLSLCAATLTDLRASAATLLGLLAFTFFTLARRHKQAMEAGFTQAMWALGQPALIAILTLSFYIVPLSLYTRVANGEGLPSGIEFVGTTPALQLIGMAPVNTSLSHLRIQFPLAAVPFFLLGAILVGISVRRGANVYFVGILGMAVNLLPSVASLTGRLPAALADFIGASNWLVLLMVVVPVGAAIGAWSFAWMILHPSAVLRNIREARSLAVVSSARGLQAAPPSVVAIVIVAASLSVLAGFARTSATRLPYGPRPEGVNPRDLWDRQDAGLPSDSLSQLDPRNWPQMNIAGDRPEADEAERLKSLVGNHATARVDVSPNLAEPVRTAAISLDVSQVGVSNPRLSLIQPGWAFEQNVLFSRDLGVDEYGNPTSLNGVAKWFGINYVMLDPKLDATDTFQAAGWSAVSQEPTVQVWRSPEETPLATLTTKPAVLVLEKPGRETFMTIYRLANDGLLPYDDALLAEGRKKVDEYTLEELEPFDAILMVGYDYNNSRKAWNLLKVYVEQGGSLFVDTGWQYAVAEWEFDRAPDVLPVSKLRWTDYGMGTDYTLEDEAIGGDIDVSKFKPLDWEGQAWSLSGTSRDEVRDWGQVVLSFADRPMIVAGEFGKGRVVWSGMNLLGHAQYLGVNRDELQLIENLIRWSLRGRTGEDLSPPVVSREYPDRVEFSLTGTAPQNAWLYWRESYYPDWHASINREGTLEAIPIYRGGPGFMLMSLGAISQNTLVTLSWEPSIAERIAPALSLAGVVFLLALTVDGLALDGNGFTWIKIAFFLWMPRPFLGEGSNVDWAEQKRAEIIAGRGKRLREGPTSGEHTRALAESRGDGSRPPGAPGDDGHSLARGIPVEASLDKDEEALLMSWLEKTGHQDDAWAAKLIGRKQSQLNSEAGRKRS